MLCYKIVRPIDGRLMSCSDNLPNGWAVEYKLGEFVTPNLDGTCLFCLSSNVPEWVIVKHAIAEGLEPYYAECEQFSDSVTPQNTDNIVKFWFNGGENKPIQSLTKYGFDSVVCASKVKLLKRIV